MGEDMRQKSTRTGLEPGTTVSRTEASVHGVLALATMLCDARGDSKVEINSSIRLGTCNIW